MLCLMVALVAAGAGAWADALKHKEPQPDSRVAVSPSEASNPACVSQYVIDRFGRAPSVKRMTEKPPKLAHVKSSFEAVQAALTENKLAAGSLVAPSADPGKWLEAAGFINVKNCPSLESRFKNAKQLPTGAVVLYQGGRAEIRTATGFWSDHPRTKTGDYVAKAKVAAIYVKAD